MRLGADGDVSRARETVVAALEAGITVFDTAHAYGEAEALLARILSEVDAGRRARVVTKGGMSRPYGGWRADGRASAIRRDCEESLERFGAGGIDLYLLHAPDPRTPWTTSLRALRRLRDEGLVRRIGVSNANLRQLDVALDEAEVAAIEVAISPFEDDAILGGVVGRAIERGLFVLAHSPLGGPDRVDRVGRDETLREVAGRVGASAEVVALRALLEVSDRIVPIPGATRPETARAAASAARLALDAVDRERLRARFRADAMEVRRAPRPESQREVVVLAGLPGAGKTTRSAALVADGFERLSRDDRGGSLRALGRALDRMLAAGAEKVVVDATFGTRASRRELLEVVSRHPVAVRCVFLDTPLAQAQVNVILRMLDVHRRLLEPEELGRGRTPDMLAPMTVYRMVRDLEPPTDDEGFTSVTIVPFERRPRAEHDRAARFVAIGAAVREEPTDQPRLVYGWRGDGRDTTEIQEAVQRRLGEVAFAWCGHEAGPPRCWCRPPLPGLLLEFALRERVDPAKSVVVGTDSFDRRMAEAMGARYEE